MTRESTLRQRSSHRRPSQGFLSAKNPPAKQDRKDKPHAPLASRTHTQAMDANARETAAWPVAIDGRSKNRRNRKCNNPPPPPATRRNAKIDPTPAKQSRPRVFSYHRKSQPTMSAPRAAAREATMRSKRQPQFTNGKGRTIVDLPGRPLELSSSRQHRRTTAASSRSRRL
ncbi:hypothetical protein ACHAWF_005232 [Thalassiosira exigua]